MDGSGVTLRDRRELAAMLDSLADDARSGEIVGLFVVTRSANGDYSCCYHTDDLEDLLVQVRTEVIHAQTMNDAVEQAAETRH